jgi:hypothetical protein
VLTDRRVFLGISAMLFAASAAVTVAWGGAMAATGGMWMPGGWTMSMAWMRMPGQSWPGAAASFLGKWTVMTAAMMLPSLVPTLERHRRAAAEAAAGRVGRLTALVGLGYFAAWIGFGAAVYPVGVALAEVAMRWPVRCSSPGGRHAGSPAVGHPRPPGAPGRAGPGRSAPARPGGTGCASGSTAVAAARGRWRPCWPSA